MKKALMLTGVYWNETIQRHHQIAFYLLKQGYVVYFVEHIVSAEFNVKKLVMYLSKNKKVKEFAKNKIPDGIHLIKSGLTSPQGGVFELYNIVKIKQLLIEIGKDFDVVINYLPVNTTRKIIEKIDYRILIYDCVRNFSGWNVYKYPSNIQKEERILTDKADLILTDSYYLTNKFMQYSGKLHQFLPSVSEEWIRGCKHRIVTKIKKITYFGTLGVHINTDILSKLIQNGYEVHIWGAMPL